VRASTTCASLGLGSTATSRAATPPRSRARLGPRSAWCSRPRPATSAASTMSVATALSRLFLWRQPGLLPSRRRGGTLPGGRGGLRPHALPLGSSMCGDHRAAPPFNLLLHSRRLMDNGALVWTNTRRPASWPTSLRSLQWDGATDMGMPPPPIAGSYAFLASDNLVWQRPLVAPPAGGVGVTNSMPGALAQRKGDHSAHVPNGILPLGEVRPRPPCEDTSVWLEGASQHRRATAVPLAGGLDGEHHSCGQHACATYTFTARLVGEAVGTRERPGTGTAGEVGAFPPQPSCSFFLRRCRQPHLLPQLAAVRSDVRCRRDLPLSGSRSAG